MDPLRLIRDYTISGVIGRCARIPVPPLATPLPVFPFAAFRPRLANLSQCPLSCPQQQGALNPLP